MRARLPLADRAAAAWSFLGRAFFRLAFLAGVAWATVMFMDPCSPGVMVCSAVPLIRQPYMGRGPLWWQRLVLRVRLLRLGGRQRSAQQDVQMLRRDMAIHRALLDTASTDLEAHYHRNELLELGDLLDARINAAALADDEIDWARSDLGRPQ